MKISGIESIQANLTKEDTLKYDSKNLVSISCPAKGTVTGYFLSDIKLGLNARWENAMGMGTSGGIGAQVLALTETVNQYTLGTSVNQPFLSRKMWKGTDPLVFSLPMRFVANASGGEVMRKVNLLLTMAVPRATAEPCQDLGTPIGVFVVPGPGVLSGLSGNEAGDPVSISIGNIVSYEKCFITSVEVSLSNSLDQNGMPLYADATITIHTFESLYCKNGHTNMLRVSAESFSGFDKKKMEEVSDEKKKGE